MGVGVICRVFVALSVVLAAGCGESDGEGDRAGQVTFRGIAAVRLAAPRNEQEAAYLGVPSDGPEFKLTDVKSPVLLVQLFDMYCNNCQRDAPEVNRFYELAQAAGLKDRVRFVGIGKNNTEIEVGIYRDRYHVGFPLLADPHKTNTKLLGIDRTPTFIIVDLDGKKVVHQQWGIGSVETLLGKLKTAAKLSL